MMKSNSKLLISTLRGKKLKEIPFWFMRQAGRYLPEYKELRSTTQNFLDYCYSPEKASEATLQPIKRFGMSGAIIFSDILVVPHAIGVEVGFLEGKGPKLNPVTDRQELKVLSTASITQKLSPVYKALQITKKALPENTALIGFIGAPWTLATYVVEGKSGSDFTKVKSIAENDRLFFDELMVLLTKAVIIHAKEQIRAGAEVIQLFDSWAGILNGEGYENWVIEPASRIVRSIKSEFPDIPIVAFPRQSGSKFLDYAKQVRPDAINVDDSVPLEWIKNELSNHVIIQGNLDNALLASDKEEMLKAAKDILFMLSDKPFVFNLGHGILPHTPIENISALCDLIRNFR